MPKDNIGSVMVVGGGIGGIQSALDLANSGFLVHLVEKSPAIGGVMSALDKTFPTNDCSMCILSPKLVEAGRHLNINLITCAEVAHVDGEQGDFKVTLNKRPRYVEPSKCTSCGDCVEVCPVSLPNDYNQGFTEKKAIYKKYAQAIPGAFAVEKGDKAPCRLACPAGLNVQGYVQMVRQGKYREALQIIMEDLPLPGVLGRICSHGCENACRRCEVDEPVAIRDLKRLAADRFDPRNIEIPCLPKRDEKVAIVGSGPAGLSAAYHLARKGVLSTIFEAMPLAGGMLRVGIPAHRLPRWVLDRDIEVVANLGVEIKLNTPIGESLTIDDLFANGYKAVYIAIGAHKGIELGIPGEKANGVRQGVDYLREINLQGKAETLKRVAIIGGGNVAIDVSRCVIRNGAEEVCIVYRRSRKEMPAFEEEILAAEAEGVQLIYLAAPQEILVDNGRVTGLRCIRMELTDPDSSGRFRPVPIPGSEFEIETDQVFQAIGQRPDLSAIGDMAGLEFTRWGTIETDAVTYATRREGVFAGGDVQSGPWVAIGAIAAGREAAESIVRYLDGRDMKEDREPIHTEDPVYRAIPADVATQPRVKMPELPVDQRRNNFEEVELGYGEDEGKYEAGRCLNCGFCCECYQCVEVCRPKAITIDTHAQTPEKMEIRVGSIILSPGFSCFDPSGLERYGHGMLPNVVTSIEFERILSATGPFKGHLVRPSDKREPKKIAWLQCVGSRDIREDSHGYCSGVCCMYAIKQTIIAKEHGDTPLDTAVFFMDMRTYGKDFDKYYTRAKDESGVRFIRSRVHTIEPVENGNLKLRYPTESGELVDEIFDMVVLSVGLTPSKDAKALAERLNIDLNAHGYALTKDFTPVNTSREGIYVCGAFQGPKDIPQSVMEASAAAAQATGMLSESRWSLTRTKELPPEKDFSGEPPRIGVFVCNCGINIGGVADVPAVRDYARTLPNVIHVEENLFTCSQDTQENMKQVIVEKGINRVVVASCSPRTHEPLFQETIRETGLNKYLFEMANIRDQNTWVHMQNPEGATAKAKELVRMAVAKAAYVEPLQQVVLNVKQAVLVVGGGVAGMEAALGVANQGIPAYLVEKSGKMGGVAHQLLETWQGEKVKPYLDDLTNRVQNHERIRVLLETEVTHVTGTIGNFVTTVVSNNGSQKSEIIEHGAAILATGGKEYKPTEYLYGRHPSVLTHLDLDDEFSGNGHRVKNAMLAVFIQCVGSRTPERPYCSRVCCTHSLKSALKLKTMNPSMSVFILYRDIRSYGFREDLYKEAREKGIQFVRYDLENPPELTRNDGNTLRLTVTDHILQQPLELEPDLVVLAAAILPNENKKLFEAFKVPVNAEGFLVEAHAKLRPVDFGSEGLFLAGIAHYPKSLDESIVQARAAVSRTMNIVSKERILVGGVIASVNPDRCAACLTCVRTCPYAIPRIGEEGYAVIEPAECHGCGVCVSECPGKAITLQHFTDEQINAKTVALFNAA